MVAVGLFFPDDRAQDQAETDMAITAVVIPAETVFTPQSPGGEQSRDDSRSG